VAAALQRRGEGVAGQVLVYPAMDPTLSGASYDDADQRMLARHEMEACWTAYRGDTPLDHPELAPLNADLAGQPPALVVVAGEDILRSDGEAYADALRAAGVDVTFSSYDDMTHGFLRWGGVVDRSRELIREVAEFAAAHLR
jgi:acetyl esterase